jgi:hypothetical protein
MKVVAPRGLGGQAIMAWKDSRVNLARMGCGTLVPLVTFVVLLLADIGAFVALAVTGRVLDLSALIVLLMLRSIVVTNAIVLHEIEQHNIEAGPNIITGLAVSLQVTALPVAVIAAGIWIAYSVGGELYVVALAATVMLTMDSIVVAVNSYDPFTDNADGIARMAELAHEVRTIADALDAVGHTTPTVTTGYAIGSAATTTSMGRTCHHDDAQHAAGLIIEDADRVAAGGGDEDMAVGIVHKRRRPDRCAPIVVMTAVRDAPEHAAQIAATGYLAKPFDLADLLACIARHRPSHE